MEGGRYADILGFILSGGTADALMNGGGGTSVGMPGCRNGGGW